MSTTLSPSANADPWVDLLRVASDEQLATLFTLRPDVLLAGPNNLAEAAAHLVSSPSVAAYYEGTDRASRQVMEVLCVLPPRARLEALASALGCSPAEAADVLGRLSMVCIVRRDGDEVVANPGLARVLRHPCRLGPPAAGLLEKMTGRDLGAMAKHLGLAGSGTKLDLVERISQALSDARHLGRLRESAPAGTERLLGEAKGWPEFQLSYGVAAMSRSGDHPVGWCLQRGLLLASGYTTVVVPREVGLALRGGRFVEGFSPGPPPLPSRPLDQEQVDRGAAEAAASLVRDVAAVLEEWSARPAKLLQAGGLGVREVRRAAKLTARSETDSARLVELAAVAGLVASDGDLVMPTVRFDDWQALAPAQRWVVLAAALMQHTGHLGAVGLRDADGKPVPPLSAETLDVVAAAQRLVVLSLLAFAGPGHAVEPASLVEAARWSRPALFEAPGEADDTVIDWVVSEAELTGLACSGALSTFGRLLLLDGEKSGAGEALARSFPPVVDEVILQADLTATVPGEPSPALRAELDLLADVESSGAATVWRFSEATVRRGFDAGQSAAEITGFLEEHAALGVPQPLAYLVEDLARRHGKVRVGTAGSYVRCDDASLLDELRQARRAARLELRLLATGVAVSPRPAGEVTETLRAAGYLASPESADGTLVVTRPPARRAPAPAPTGRPAPVRVSEVAEDPAVLADIIARLREAPIAVARPPRESPRPAPSAPRAPSGGTRPLPGLRLVGDEPRPTGIAMDPDDIAELLEEAWTSDWTVRLAYENAQGFERECFVEVLDVTKAKVWVEHVGDRRGRAELQIARVAWARVLTEAEEDLLYG